MINDFKQQVEAAFQHGTAFTHSAFSAWLICAERMAWGNVPGNVTIEHDHKGEGILKPRSRPATEGI